MNSKRQWFLVVVIALSSSVLVTQWFMPETTTQNSPHPVPLAEPVMQPEPVRLAVPLENENLPAAPGLAADAVVISHADWQALQQQLVGLHERLEVLEQAKPTAAQAARQRGIRVRDDAEEQRALLQAGIDRITVDLWQQRRSAQELERLELRDQAVREGWFGTERFIEASRDLNSRRIELRDEIGDDAYDRYLYASERNNRLMVASVIAGSAAADAGIQAGDVVLSYDAERLFHYADLIDATSAGNREDWVEIGLQRGADLISFWIPRGPIGIRIEESRQVPEANR